MYMRCPCSLETLGTASQKKGELYFTSGLNYSGDDLL